MKVKRTVSDLENFEVLSFLSDEDLEEFKSNLFQRTYKKNQLLFTVGDPRERIYFLTKGYVKLERTNADASMLYVDYIRPYDLFPYGGMFEDKYYHLDAYALTDISVYYIPTRTFEKLIRRNNEQLLYIIHRLSKILEQHERRLQAITTKNARDRVEQSVTYLMYNFGRAEGDDILINVPITITEIAKISGTCRETASNVFRELKCDGLLSMESRKIRIHEADYFLEKVQ